MLPALLTNTSNFFILLRILLNLFKSVTSHSNFKQDPFVFFIIFSTLSKSDKVLLIIITFAPASANAIAQAFPRPFPAPVTKAVLFIRFIFLNI